MTDINHEIRSLLFEHDYVTVPGLGAFIAHYEPSVFNPENNSFSPPNRRITFNSVLKQDDGLLMSSVIKKKNVSTQRAKDIISEYVQEIKNTLLSKYVFEFGGIGELELSTDQKVIFSPAFKNFYNESYGFDTLYSFNNNNNFTYSNKYFEGDASETNGYEFDTMNITMSKIPKKTFYTKFLYALPLVILASGLISVLIFNPSTAENANSSLNPIDYVDSVKSWFAAPKAKKEITEAPKFTESVKIEQLNATAATANQLKLVVGIFSQSENANKLYNKLVLNNLAPEITLRDNKNIVHIVVGSENEAVTVSDKLEQLIGERGVLLKN